MPFKILVADDSPTIRRRATTVLVAGGHEVECVEDAEAAWQALETGPVPDALLCDIVMPGVDGYELCARVRGDERFADIPVLLLRGTFDPWDETKAEAAGADGFVRKPFEPEDLLGTLREVLGGETTAPSEATPAQDVAAEAEASPESEVEPEPTAATPPEPTEPLHVERDTAPLAEPGPVAAAASEEANPFDDFLDAPTPAAPAAASTPASEGPGPPASLDALDDATLDRLAERIVARLSTDQLERIAWDVVPDVAEALIRKRILEIESKLSGD